MSKSRKASTGDKIRYSVDNFMARGGLSIFLALLSLFFIAFVLMSGVRVVVGLFVDDETLKATADRFWRVFLQISDAGAIAEDTEASPFNKAAGIITVFFGLVLFSSLVAFITNQFEERIQSLRKGKSRVIENGHTLILGFRSRVVEIIRELIIANESEKDAAIVILAEEDKEVMDDFFNEHLPDRKTTRIITRNGTTSSLEALRKMNVEQAKSIVILNGATASDSQTKKAAEDARALKTIMAVVASLEDGTDLPPIIVELHRERNRTLAESIAPGRITTMDESSILAKLLVQTSRTSGLSIVYSNLVGFEGNEVYFFKPEGGWKGMNFGELLFHFDSPVVLGFRLADGKISLNPPSDFKPQENDSAIVLASDDSAIKFLKDRFSPNIDKPIPSLSSARKTERQLIAGWNTKVPTIIEEYAKYVLDGSDIDIVVAEPDDALTNTFREIQKQHDRVKLRLIKADIHSPEVLEKLSPHTYDNVILMASEGENSEEIDAESISILLQLRQFFKGIENSTGRHVDTKIITEVMDSENIELVLQTGVKDFLISNQFVSKIFAQVSQDPDVMKVYDDLFSPEGSEIYLKKAIAYFDMLPGKVKFADCVNAALKRREVCFGLKIASQERDPEKNYGVYMIPEKNLSFEIRPEDELIVLSEDES